MCLSQQVEEGTTVWTDFQTAGKGQRGTSWESAPGMNLLFSIVLYPNFILPNEQFIISQIASVAIKEVLSKYVSDISIKWPNDIYWKDKKICGILIENVILEDSVVSSEIGIGININQEAFVSNAPNPVSLKQITQEDYNRKEILSEIIARILFLYNKAKTAKTAIVDTYKQSLYRKDGFFSYQDKQGELFSACINDIEASGLLVLTTSEGETKRFAFKEIIFR